MFPTNLTKQLHVEDLVLFYLYNLNPHHLQEIIRIIQCDHRQLLHEKVFLLVPYNCFLGKIEKKQLVLQL